MLNGNNLSAYPLIMYIKGYTAQSVTISEIRKYFSWTPSHSGYIRFLTNKTATVSVTLKSENKIGKIEDLIKNGLVLGSGTATYLLTEDSAGLPARSYYKK